MKTSKQLKHDWEEAANLENYRNTIAGGYKKEASFKGVGKTQTKAVLTYLNRYKISIANKRIVELGCGAGRMTEFLAKEAKWVFAIDISSKMLERFKERLGSIQNVSLMRSGDLSVMPDNSVELILSFLVFQHNTEHLTRKYLRDGVRVLKPGGYFAFQIPIANEHKVIRSRTKATDMVRWTKKELISLANTYRYTNINPIGSWINIWRKETEVK